MKIKTYPLQFTEADLERIRKAAINNGQTIKDFILSAIEAKIQKGATK